MVDTGGRPSLICGRTIFGVVIFGVVIDVVIDVVKDVVIFGVVMDWSQSSRKSLVLVNR